jgi:hypothetical protein
MGLEQQKRIVVTVDDQSVANVAALAETLRAKGMQIDQTLTATGIITGSIASTALDALRSVPGIKAVEPDDEMHAI